MLVSKPSSAASELPTLREVDLPQRKALLSPELRSLGSGPGLLSPGGLLEQTGIRSPG